MAELYRKCWFVQEDHDPPMWVAGHVLGWANSGEKAGDYSYVQVVAIVEDDERRRVRTVALENISFAEAKPDA